MNPCNKCLGQDMSVRYVRQGAHIGSNSDIDKVDNYLETHYRSSGDSKKEFLIYTCQSCGYKVAEDCKDKQV